MSRRVVTQGREAVLGLLRAAAAPPIPQSVRSRSRHHPSMVSAFYARDTIQIFRNKRDARLVTYWQRRLMLGHKLSQ